MSGMIGAMVGQYRITEKLGQGGMGAVYKAVDTLIEREVAIKMLHREIAQQPNLLERFRAEAVTVAKLNHSGIATLYSFVQQGADFFMVMEYVPGKTLEQIERERGALAWQIAVPLTGKILEAIQPAHEQGILHRDLKPANIMLTTWGTVKVMDFGIARMLGTARMNTEGRLIGTLEYIPPERIEGKPSDARGDLYSLAVVLFEMLGHRLPFQHDSEFELMRCHLQQAMPSFREIGCEVPLAIEEVIRRAMAKSPADRYDSCEALAEALAQASGHLTITKKAVVDLVGPLTVDAMGTAGHVFTPGEMPNLAAPQTLPHVRSALNSESPAPAAPAIAASAASRASVPTASAPVWLRENWQLAAAIAVVFVGIGIGVIAGLSRRPPAAVNPGTVLSLPPLQTPLQTQPTPPAMVNSGTRPVPPQAPRDSSVRLTPRDAKAVDIPQNDENKSAARQQQNREARALRALDVDLSGNWQGEYTNYGTNQITKVNLQMSKDRTDLLTGTLMFDSGGSNSASCAITGVYNPQSKFMLLDVGYCQGHPPAYLQGKIGFSSVEPTDHRVLGVDSLHNSLLSISRQ
jgi:serine/threonine-protein kinase